MNSILQSYLRDFVVVFLDDILIFSKSLSSSEHMKHVATVLETMKANQVYRKPSKCEFAQQEVLFLGHRITGMSISPDMNKIAAVEDWPVPSSVKEHFDIYTDNMAVTYLRTKRHFSKREARWIEFLVDYHFTINHKPGKDNVADPLSRRRDLNALDSHQDQGPHLTAIEYAVELNAEVSETLLVFRADAADVFALVLGVVLEITDA
ncbi:uncharacterized protein LOC135813166 [Sycon ciliatum]|uniref:uncharacterized protein LOC135813166 n=1 Tax=Sycon ciliatum TaxID=27933 RepID=UPI0031F6874A